MRLDEAGELGLLAELERRGLAQGIEHDAAEVAGLVVTQDALVEGVHFRFDLVSWRDLGFRAAAVNISDLAASGAEPLALIVSLCAAGHDECRRRGRALRGAERGGRPRPGRRHDARRQLLLSVTALGRSERVPGRAGARPGDLLVVTGPLGAAGAAFREGRLPRPPLRVEEGKRLARVATAMLDVSDGLARRRRRISPGAPAAASSIELERVPLAPGAFARGPRLRRGLRAAGRRRPIRSASRSSAGARRDQASR